MRSWYTFLALVSIRFLADVFCLMDWKIEKKDNQDWKYLVKIQKCVRKYTWITGAHLGNLLLSDGKPDLPPPCIQLLNSEMFFLAHRQQSIMRKLCKDFGDVGMPLVQQILLATFLLFLHLLQFSYSTTHKVWQQACQKSSGFRVCGNTYTL